MSEKQVDQRVLVDLRKWVGIGQEKVSDDDLLNKSGNVRTRLECNYAYKDFIDAIMKEIYRVHGIFKRGEP